MNLSSCCEKRFWWKSSVNDRSLKLHAKTHRIEIVFSTKHFMQIVISILPEYSNHRIVASIDTHRNYKLVFCVAADTWLKWIPLICLSGRYSRNSRYISNISFRNHDYTVSVDLPTLLAYSQFFAVIYRYNVIRFKYRILNRDIWFNINIYVSVAIWCCASQLLLCGNYLTF